MNSDVPQLFDGAEPPDREQFVLNQRLSLDLDYCKGLFPTLACGRRNWITRPLIAAMAASIGAHCRNRRSGGR